MTTVLTIECWYYYAQQRADSEYTQHAESCEQALSIVYVLVVNYQELAICFWVIFLNVCDGNLLIHAPIVLYRNIGTDTTQ